MIYTINSKCGSGKTHWALNEATKLIQNKKRVMIVAPSLDLQNEMSNRLGFTPHFVINYTTNNEGGVATSIANYLKNPPSKYEILIITAAAFVTINKFPNKKKWICFIDEELSVFDNISFNSSDSSNYAFGNDLMNDIEKIADLKLNEEIGFVEFKLKSLPLKEIKFLKSICYGSKAADFVYPPFQKFIQLLLNKNMRVFGDSESIVMFKLGNDTAKMWSELNEQLFLNFQNLYIMGAEIQRSKMVVYLKLKGLKIEPLQIQQRFEYHEQPITIKWFTKHKPWSKSYYNSINEVAGISQFELYDLLVSETIGNEPILLQNNKGNPFKYIQKPIYMNFEVRGINKFDKIHSYCESGAYNMTPACFAKMEKLGFDISEIQLHNSLSHLYQGMMRSNLRNGEFNNNVVFVPTEQMALNLRNIYFPNGKVEQIENGEFFNL